MKFNIYYYDYGKRKICSFKDLDFEEFCQLFKAVADSPDWVHDEVEAICESCGNEWKWEY